MKKYLINANSFQSVFSMQSWISKCPKTQNNSQKIAKSYSIEMSWKHSFSKFEFWSEFQGLWTYLKLLQKQKKNYVNVPESRPAQKNLGKKCPIPQWSFWSKDESLPILSAPTAHLTTIYNGHFKVNWARMSSYCGKMCCWSTQNWSALTFWLKLHSRVSPLLTQKFWAGLLLGFPLFC